jgi:hypothetical protein
MYVKTQVLRLAFVGIMASFASLAAAQEVDVKSIPTGGEESTTTIEIRKGKKADQASTTTTAEKPAGPQWKVEDGNAEVEGEPGPTTKDARANWKTACADWRKEFRDDNKENKILSMNCGSVSCGGDAGSKVCSSKAAFKIKTRVD